MRSATIADDVQRGLLAASRARLPREMVAALFGRAIDDHGDVLTMQELTNTAASGDRFAVDPIELASAEAAFRRRDLQLLGFAHSHPHGAPQPSATDRRELWRDCLQMIVADDGERRELRAFVLRGDEPIVQPVALLREQRA